MPNFVSCSSTKYSTHALPSCRLVFKVSPLVTRVTLCSFLFIFFLFLFFFFFSFSFFSSSSSSSSSCARALVHSLVFATCPPHLFHGHCQTPLIDSICMQLPPASPDSLACPLCRFFFPATLCLSLYEKSKSGAAQAAIVSLVDDQRRKEVGRVKHETSGLNSNFISYLCIALHICTSKGTYTGRDGDGDGVVCSRCRCKLTTLRGSKQIELMRSYVQSIHSTVTRTVCQQSPLTSALSREVWHQTNQVRLSEANKGTKLEVRVCKVVRLFVYEYALVPYKYLW